MYDTAVISLTSHQRAASARPSHSQSKATNYNGPKKWTFIGRLKFRVFCGQISH